MERLELADVRSRVVKGQQVDGGERFGVTLVEVQSVNHGRAVEHDSHTRMAVAVDAAFVAFRDGRIRLRVHGTMMARARCIDTLHQATDNLPLPLKGLDPMPPMIADMHLGTAVPTHAISHIKKHPYQRPVVQPPMSQRFASLHPPMDTGNLQHYPPTCQDHS